MEHVALRGKLDHKEISWWTKLILRIGAWKNDDPVAKKEELEGFNYMDKSSIEPIIKLIEKFKSNRKIIWFSDLVKYFVRAIIDKKFFKAEGLS